MHQVNRASGQQIQEAAEEEGTLPWLNWMKGTCDYIIQFIFQLPDYEIAFDPFHELDRLKQAMADKTELEAGMYTVNEKRQDRGDDPSDNPAADQLNIYTAQGVVELGKQLKTGPNASGTNSARTTTHQITGGSTGESGAQQQRVYKNGVTNWATCEKHKDSYPRTYCSGCQYAEKVRMSVETTEGRVQL